VEIVVTFREIMDKGMWDKFCEMKGLNVWCVNEGLADSDEKVELTEDEARKLGFLK